MRSKPRLNSVFYFPNIWSTSLAASRDWIASAPSVKPPFWVPCMERDLPSPVCCDAIARHLASVVPIQSRSTGRSVNSKGKYDSTT